MNPHLAHAQNNLARLQDLMAEATAAIARSYFLLPVADEEGGDPIVQYRERVYAYELYHQLRSRWPEPWPYSLAGEIDKDVIQSCGESSSTTRSRTCWFIFPVGWTATWP